MRWMLPAFALLAACQPVGVQTASLGPEGLTLGLAGGVRCQVPVPDGPFHVEVAGCPGVTSAFGGPRVEGQPEILLMPVGEGRLGGAGPAARVWVWTRAGPYLFSR